MDEENNRDESLRLSSAHDDRGETGKLVDTLTMRILESDNAIAELKAQVGDIRTRQADSAEELTADHLGRSGVRPPSELELFYARMLEEAGLFSKDITLPPLTVIKLERSQLLYLRTQEPRVSYGAKLEILRLEAALNALQFALNYTKDPEHLSEADAYQINQRVAHSITSQIPTIGDKGPTQGEYFTDGEWAVRKGIAMEMESFKLPYRLEADYRVNMQDGNVAFELETTPAQCFPKSAWVQGLKRIVPTTALMRKRGASQYAMRVGILLAAAAFRCTPKVKHVFVAAVHTSGNKRECLYSIEFNRAQFAQLNLDEIHHPLMIFAQFNAHMDPYNETLNPIPQDLFLSDERFCPPFRYEPVETSKRNLQDSLAYALGTDRVRNLGINEGGQRVRLAETIGRYLGNSTSQDVNTLLTYTKNQKNQDIQEAAKRTISKLIDGTLSPHDPLAIEREFTDGDVLTQAIHKAQRMETEQTQQASNILEEALDDYESDHLFLDSDEEVYRFFRSYSDRVMYNKLKAKPNQKVTLLPDSYYQIHLMLATDNLELGQNEKAKQFGRRIIEFAPQDPNGFLLVARAQASQQHIHSAINTLSKLLEIAYDPQTVGSTYAALGAIFEQIGDDKTAAACYSRSMQFASSTYLMSSFALNQIMQKHPGTYLSLKNNKGVDYQLTSHQIPIAPTEEISEIFYNALRASFDAEVFPVAKNFIDTLSMLSGDDVVVDINHSMEGEPDR